MSLYSRVALLCTGGLTVFTCSRSVAVYILCMWVLVQLQAFEPLEMWLKSLSLKFVCSGRSCKLHSGASSSSDCALCLWRPLCISHLLLLNQLNLHPEMSTQHWNNEETKDKAGREQSPKGFDSASVIIVCSLSSTSLFRRTSWFNLGFTDLISLNPSYKTQIM